MKKLFFSVACIFSTLFLFCQNQRYSLSVKTDDKISMHGFSYWQVLELKSKDTAFTYRLHSGNPDIIHNLEAGTYTIAVSSLFNDRVKKKVVLKKKTPLVKIKGLQSFYKRIPETQTLSEKLKLNDTLYILFSSSANESVKEKIGLTKTTLGYKALQFQGTSHEIFQEMLIKDDMYKEVLQFEKDGKKANSPKAETAPMAEVYTLELNREMISFIVPGEWGGLNKLKAILFLVEGK